jgi:hypothetical protein
MHNDLVLKHIIGMLSGKSKALAEGDLAKYHF